MKNRWFGGLVLAMALALAACAPPTQGGGSTSPPESVTPASGAPESVAPESVAPESVAPSEAEASPTPYDY